MPDLRGRFPIGAGQGKGLTNHPTGQTGGRKPVPIPPPEYVRVSTSANTNTGKGQFNLRVAKEAPNVSDLPHIWSSILLLQLKNTRTHPVIDTIKATTNSKQI